MKFNLDRFHPLLQLMPGFIRANDFAIKEPSIPSLLESMSREAEMNRVGACGILARLADVLTATMIRSWVEHGCGEATGWLAALRNHEVGRVLAAVHLDPARHWSVEELARIMGASRSSFAQRFLDIVGKPLPVMWRARGCNRPTSGYVKASASPPSPTNLVMTPKPPSAVLTRE